MQAFGLRNFSDIWEISLGGVKKKPIQNRVKLHCYVTCITISRNICRCNRFSKHDLISLHILWHSLCLLGSRRVILSKPNDRIKYPNPLEITLKKKSIMLYFRPKESSDRIFILLPRSLFWSWYSKTDILLFHNCIGNYRKWIGCEILSASAQPAWIKICDWFGNNRLCSIYFVTIRQHAYPSLWSWSLAIRKNSMFDNTATKSTHILCLRVDVGCHLLRKSSVSLMLRESTFLQPLYWSVQSMSTCLFLVLHPIRLSQRAMWFLINRIFTRKHRTITSKTSNHRDDYKTEGNYKILGWFQNKQLTLPLWLCA